MGWPTRLILALVAGGALVVVVLVAFAPSEDTDASEAGAEPTSEFVGDRAEPGQGTAAGADGRHSASGDSTGDSATWATSATAPPGIDQVDLAAAEACLRLRSGSTVDEVAGWFESGWDVSPEEAEPMFREIIERALTRDCPDVVPSG